VREAANAHLYDISLRPGARVELPIDPTFRDFVMTVQGEARVEIDDQVGELGPEGLELFEVGDGAVAIEAGSTSAQLFVGAGVPLRQPSYMRGGFCLSTEDRVRAAAERYRAGEMGTPARPITMAPQAELLATDRTWSQTMWRALLPYVSDFGVFRINANIKPAALPSTSDSRSILG
jgi:hypothetical protein